MALSAFTWLLTFLEVPESTTKRQSDISRPITPIAMMMYPTGPPLSDGLAHAGRLDEEAQDRALRGVERGFDASAGAPFEVVGGALQPATGLATDDLELAVPVLEELAVGDRREDADPRDVAGAPGSRRS